MSLLKESIIMDSEKQSEQVNNATASAERQEEEHQPPHASTLRLAGPDTAFALHKSKENTSSTTTSSNSSSDDSSHGHTASEYLSVGGVTSTETNTDTGADVAVLEVVEDGRDEKGQRDEQEAKLLPLQRRKGDDNAGEGGGIPEISLADAYERLGYGWLQIRVLLICGLCFCTDSIEVGLLTFLQVEAKRYFDLSDLQESTLTSVVFAGELVGALIFGPLADRYGRKAVAFLSASLVASAGLISAFSVSYMMLVVMRTIVGIGIGGIGVPFDLLAEMMPPHNRGRALYGIEFFWTCGTMLVNGIAWATLTTLGWRYLVAFCAIPVILAIAAFPFMPESPHWLVLMGRNKEAVKVIKHGAKLNKKESEFPADFMLVSTYSFAEGEEEIGTQRHAAVTMMNPLFDEGNMCITGRDGDEDEDDDNDDSDTAVLLSSQKSHARGHGRMVALKLGKDDESAGDHGEDDDEDDDDDDDDDDGVGHIVEKVESESASPFRLFGKEYVWITTLLWISWCTFGFTYYGTVIIAPAYFSSGSGDSGAQMPNETMMAHGGGNMSSMMTNITTAVPSVNVSEGRMGRSSGDVADFDYPALFATGASEFIAVIIGFILIDRMSRRLLGGTGYLINGIATLLLIIPMSQGLGIFTLTVARASIFLGSSLTWVMTPEMYPTAIRAVGHSWCNAVARIGAFITPYWGDASAISLSIRILVYGIVGLITAAATFLLPDTRGKVLH